MSGPDIAVSANAFQLLGGLPVDLGEQVAVADAP
jgi:hypothetical protein